MADNDKLISTDLIETPKNDDKNEKRTSHAKLPWYFASGFLLFWILLFFAVVVPFFNRLPTALTKEDDNKNEFIAERAYENLYKLSKIGNKLIGSMENEVEVVSFILNELAKIKAVLLTDYFEMEIDVSRVSGAFPYNDMLTTYQGVQNIVVKLTPKGSTSENYLLINSHFDSKPFTSSASDAGIMVVTMLEVLRVLATTKQSFDHPLVFLFNGSEEDCLQGSHGFITQHKWAPKCKAVINLEGGGGGGRDILFQTGPNHSWIVNYYKKYAKHPFATTMAEEVFQARLIPSDTDFRQFSIYGNIPGLDIVQTMNGFIYHTKYDTIDSIPREALQNSGDNALGLVRGLANATELKDIRAYRHSGHSVFFDFLGLFFIHYSVTTAQFINSGVAALSFGLVFISLCRMTSASEVSFSHVFWWFILVLTVQVVSFAFGLLLPLIVAYIFDNMGLPLTYFSSHSLVVGLFVCPSLFGLSLPITIYYSLQLNDKISDAYHLQLSLHGQAVILSLLTIALTLLGLRSAYVIVIPLGFYALYLAFSLSTTLHDRGYAWTGLLKIGQIIPFLYSSSLFYTFIVVLTPSGGLSGSSFNLDLYIAGLAAIGTVLSFGFLIPLINSFRRPIFVVVSLLTVSALAMYLASSTQLGFPYRAKTSGQRVSYLQVRRMFYEYDGTLSRDESGYLFNFQDRTKETLLSKKANLTGLVSIEDDCATHMMCGQPLFDYRFVKNRHQSKWLRRGTIEPPALMKLELLSKSVLNSTNVRFEFKLTGPTQMSLFIQPYEDVRMATWSFSLSYLKFPPAPPLPYHIYFTYGIDDSPLVFFLELSKPDGDFDVPLFKLGASAHYIRDKGDAESAKFASSFPSYSIVATWPAMYKRYIF